MLGHGFPLLTVALVLVTGVVSGYLARRIHLPAVTGQIIAGILIGPSVLGIAEVQALHDLQPLTHFALGLIAVTVGNHLNLKRLRNARRRLLWLLAFEVTLTPALVFVAVYFASDASPTFAFLLAALAVSTAPATIVAIVKEGRARGVFVKTLVAAVALNNIACILLFELAHTAAAAIQGAGDGVELSALLLAPLEELAFSAALGAAAGGVLVLVAHRLVRSDQLATASMAAILFTAGLAHFLGFSALLSCLFLGVALANFTPERDEIGHSVFDDFEAAIFAIFFTLAGMELDFGYVIPAGLLALLAVGGRFAGKWLAGRLAMRLAGAPKKLRKNLGLALIPQAGVAIGLVLLVQDDPRFADIRSLLLAVGLTSVAINEIIGPVLTRLALNRSGERNRDRARLIDFLHEEHIVVGLTAETKEEAIAKLLDHLIATTHAAIDREEFLRNALSREAEVSTCLGHGLAVPHGRLKEGEEIIGVMGISRDGLPFETPDGQPVHSMVLLATPAKARDRHLEVLASLATAVSSHPNLQARLYAAKSPAHAYEILHAEDAEDFNYFLEDEREEA